MGNIIEENNFCGVEPQKKLDLIKYLLNFYFKSKIILSSEDCLLKINDICYCETEKELLELTSLGGKTNGNDR